MQTDAEQQWLQALQWVMTQPGLIEGLPGGHKPLLEPSDARLDQLLNQDHSGLMALLLSPSNSVAPCDIEIVSYTTSGTQWKKGMPPSMLATSLPERIVAFCHIRYASMQQRGRLIS